MAGLCAALPLFPAAGEARNAAGKDRNAVGETQNTDGEHRRKAGENGRAAGCRAGGAWYRDGARVDLGALKGVRSLSVTGVLFACRNGVRTAVPATR